MYLYHLKIITTEGDLHKIGITDDMDDRMKNYKSLPLLFYIVKFRKTPLAKEIETKIKSAFKGAFHNEYLRFENTNDYLIYNRMFWKGALETISDVDLDNVISLQNRDDNVLKALIGFNKKSVIIKSSADRRQGTCKYCNKNYANKYQHLERCKLKYALPEEVIKHGDQVVAEFLTINDIDPKVYIDSDNLINVSLVFTDKGMRTRLDKFITKPRNIDYIHYLESRGIKAIRGTEWWHIYLVYDFAAGMSPAFRYHIHHIFDKYMCIEIESMKT